MVWCVFKLDSDNTLSYVCYIPNKISLINWKTQFSGPGEISLFICHWSHRCFIQRVYYIFLARSIENQCDDNSILCKCFRFLLNTAFPFLLQSSFTASCCCRCRCHRIHRSCRCIFRRHIFRWRHCRRICWRCRICHRRYICRRHRNICRRCRICCRLRCFFIRMFYL